MKAKIVAAALAGLTVGIMGTVAWSDDVGAAVWSLVTVGSGLLAGLMLGSVWTADELNRDRRTEVDGRTP